MDKEFGMKYKSVITDFEGVMTRRGIFITGCDRVELTNKEGKTEWFDLPLIEFIDNGIYEKVSKNSGCNKYSDVDEALYNLNDKAKDKVTDYSGIIIGVSCSLSGDISYGLTPKYDSSVKDNNAQWFDEGRIEVIKENETKINTDKKRVGGAVPNLSIR
jgi:hypothetical protein